MLCFIATVMQARLPDEYLWSSIPYVLLQAACLPAKCFTDFTPCVIGPTWAFGLFAGAAAVGLDPFRGVPQLRSWIGNGGFNTGEAHAVLWSLAAAYACWGVVLKSVYAYQDVGSDAVASVKHIWRRLEEKAEDAVLEPIAMLQIALVASTGLGIVIGIVIGALVYMFVGEMVVMGVGLV